jgi:hypothetical protein
MGDKIRTKINVAAIFAQFSILPQIPEFGDANLNLLIKIKTQLSGELT